mgnify:CR=1 FL=1
MTDDPLFSTLDADRVLRRAAEIEGVEGRGLSLEELRSIAGEAGFAHGTIERAIAEVRGANLAAAAERPAVQKWGILVTHFSAIRDVPVAMNADQLTKVVRLFHPYREGPAQVKLEEQEITWRDGKGLRFAVSSVGGTTEIRVYVSRILPRTGRWMGWVKAAADRLVVLTLLVARQEVRGAPTFRPSLPLPPTS